MKKKGQVSVDLIISMVLAMLFFVFILDLADSQYKRTEDMIRVLDARHVAEKLAYEINSQYAAGNGAVKYVTLPETLYGGRAYNLTVFPGAVTVGYSLRGERLYSHRTAVRSIDKAAGGLSLDPGEIKITNLNGTIYLENA